MGTRIELQTLLEELLGSRNVYFQPPESIKMKYPCIVYNRSDISSKFADDAPYLLFDRYELTFITKDPDSEMIHTIASLPKCKFDRDFVSDNLNHYVYSIYY